jgi:hypothetical protein
VRKLRRRQVRPDNPAFQIGQVQALALINETATTQPAPDPVRQGDHGCRAATHTLDDHVVAVFKPAVDRAVKRWRTQMQHRQQHEPDSGPWLLQGENRGPHAEPGLLDNLHVITRQHNTDITAPSTALPSGPHPGSAAEMEELADL